MQSLLNVDEKIRLSHLEQQIQEWKRTSAEAMKAFLEIHHNKLYRQHGTFEQYCFARWNITERYAHYLLKFAQSRELLAEAGLEILPENESQARALRSLPDEQKIEAWKGAIEVAGGTVPTTSVVVEVVRSIKESGVKPLPSVGERVVIAAETSPHYRQSMTVVETRGVAVKGQLADGTQQAFLVSDLQIETPSAPMAKAKKSASASKSDTTGFNVQVLQERVSILEDKLREAIEILRGANNRAARRFIEEARSLLE